jgi:hypothetical protein
MMKDGRAGHFGLTERPILNELKVIVAEGAEKGFFGAPAVRDVLGLFSLAIPLSDGAPPPRQMTSAGTVKWSRVLSTT